MSVSEQVWAYVKDGRVLNIMVGFLPEYNNFPEVVVNIGNDVQTKMRENPETGEQIYLNNYDNGISIAIGMVKQEDGSFNFPAESGETE